MKKERVKKKDFKYHTGKKYDGMMGRCYRESDASYKHYGSRGIKVCSEWISDINNFRVWLREELTRINITEEEFIANSKNYHLDRIDTNDHYKPTNCRLVNPQTNTRNRRLHKGKKIISAEGVEHEF